MHERAEARREDGEYSGAERDKVCEGERAEAEALVVCPCPCPCPCLLRGFWRAPALAARAFRCGGAAGIPRLLEAVGAEEVDKVGWGDVEVNMFEAQERGKDDATRDEGPLLSVSTKGKGKAPSSVSRSWLLYIIGRGCNGRSQRGNCFFSQSLGKDRNATIQNFEAFEKDRKFWKGLQLPLWPRRNALTSRRSLAKLPT